MPNPSDLLVTRLCQRGLHRKVFRDQYQVDMLVRMWRNYVTREDHFSRYAEMTDHGLASVDGVATLVTDLATASDFLNDSELLLLLAAAYLHDIGMHRTSDPHYRQPMTIRNIHGYYSRLGILREPHLLVPTFDPQEVALLALLCSYHQNKAPLSEADLAAIEDHKRIRVPPGGDRLSADVSQWEPQKSLELELGRAAAEGIDLFHLRHTNEPVCPFLLAALLKLLDGCDFQVGRAGGVEEVLRHADRNRSHASRSASIMRDIDTLTAQGTDCDTYVRARIELEFFQGSLLHFARNLLIDRTMILGGNQGLGVAVHVAHPERIERLWDRIVGPDAVATLPDTVGHHLRETVRLLKIYQVDPLAAGAEQLHCDPTDRRLDEWRVDVPAANQGDRRTVHFLIAAQYMRNEFERLARALASPAAGQDYAYCPCCVNRSGCPLRQRPIPTFRDSAASWNIWRFDPHTHRQALGAVSYLGPSTQVPPRPPMPLAPRTHEVAGLSRKLARCKRLVLYGPPGRGKTTLAAAMARHLTGGDPCQVLWHQLERQESQVDDLWAALADFLARNGDFTLQNLFRGKHLTPLHEEFALDLLASGSLAGPGNRFVLCVDEFNRLTRQSRPSFWRVIHRFPCINCSQASDCRRSPGDRASCPEARSCVLLVSSKRPGFRHQEHEGLPPECVEAPALAEADARDLTARVGTAGPGLCAIWRDYGFEPAAIRLLPLARPPLATDDSCHRAFAEGLARFFAITHGRDAYGSLAELQILRLAGVLEGRLNRAHLPPIFGCNVIDPDGPFEALQERALLHVDPATGYLQAHPAWSLGNRRSGWLEQVYPAGGLVAIFIATHPLPCEDPELLRQLLIAAGLPVDRVPAVTDLLAATGRVLEIVRRDESERFALAEIVEAAAAPFSSFTRESRIRLAALWVAAGPDAEGLWQVPRPILGEISRLARLAKGIRPAFTRLADGMRLLTVAPASRPEPPASQDPGPCGEALILAAATAWASGDLQGVS